MVQISNLFWLTPMNDLIIDDPLGLLQLQELLPATLQMRPLDEGSWPGHVIWKDASGPVS